MRFVWVSYFALILFLSFAWEEISLYSMQAGELTIGQIQGRENESAYVGQYVGFRGVVTGIREDQNTAGIIYYTFFLQSEEGFQDGDPMTSDGIAVFTGRRRPQAGIGDLVQVWGTVTEFYGLTEIDDKGLSYQTIGSGYPLPTAIELNPPTKMDEINSYYEPLEGMLVKVPAAITIGPTHVACGFTVMDENHGTGRIMKRNTSQTVGHIIRVLNYSDVDCANLPPLATGDRIAGIAGPLTYHFDQYTVLLQDSTGLTISKYERPRPKPLPLLSPGQLSVATFNLENYFDAVDNTGDTAEPKPSLAEIEIKQMKLADTIAKTLLCPTILAVEEVETYELLNDLSVRLADICGFTYAITHLDTVDARGIDLALFTDTSKTTVLDYRQFQICSEIVTDIVDPAVSCDVNQQPLFARQPLIVDLDVNGIPISFIVNHLKSKREGESETEPWRIAQARALRQLVEDVTQGSPEQGVILLGDFNDYDDSTVRRILLDSGLVEDALSSIPEQERYSYIFDGESQIPDWILVSPNINRRQIWARIAHVNADYPYQLAIAVEPELSLYRSSDHDIPIVAYDLTTVATTPISKPTEPIEADSFEMGEPTPMIDQRTTRTLSMEAASDASNQIGTADRTDPFVDSPEATDVPVESGGQTVKIQKYSLVFREKELILFGGAIVVLLLVLGLVVLKKVREP